MKKTFDCVEMKYEAGLRLQAALATMTREQELAYWAARNNAMRDEIAQAKSRPTEHRDAA